MKNPESALILFYLGQQPDSEGCMIDEILGWDDELLEQVHDYIQWLFPLREQSAFNSAAPLLDEKQIQEFRSNKKLRDSLRRSFFRLLVFYGFSVVEDNGQPTVVRADTFRQKAENWLTPYNHNFLRITRILKSLTLLGLPSYAVAFERALEEVYVGYRHIIGDETLRYWRQAIRSS